MTINRWYLYYKKEGHYLPKLRTEAKSGVEQKSFIQYVNDHLNGRAEDIAGKFGISLSGARYWLRLIGFSYKKSLHHQYIYAISGLIYYKSILFLAFMMCACAPTTKKFLYTQKPSWYSYLVGDINSSVITHEHNKDVYITPASCQKVVTSLVALKTLGLDYRYKTQVYFSGNSNRDLIISLSGDPSLTTNDLVTLLKPLKEQSIKGSIIVDISKFQTKPYSDYLMVNDIGAQYSPPVSAWVLDRNQITITAKINSEERVMVYNDAKYDFYNQVLFNTTGEGKISAAWDGNLVEVIGSITPKDPILETCISPRDLNTYILNKMDIIMKELNIRGRVVILNDPTKVPSVKKLVSSHVSEPLEKTLPIAFGKSDNLFFDILYLTIINKYASKDITDWADGNIIMKDLIKVHYGVDMGKAVILDGSGLSRYNHMQTSRLYDLLVKGYKNKEFVDIMPDSSMKDTTLVNRQLPHDIKAKTGTMIGISCLCGYKMNNKSPKAFVILAQGYSHPRKEMTMIVDDFVTRALGN
jgi:D-alanyl-D-alanine carboxypeptidase/D-alanyl-D-alanine-endopeptidase (penicillin-binding protein 4)